MKGRDDRTPGPKPFASSAARRIESIIEGAERAAERVIDDSEQQARAYLAEAEADADRAVAERLASLGELTDALVAQADAIRRQSELLTRSLQEAKERLEAGGGATPPEPGGDPGEPAPPRLSAVDPAGKTPGYRPFPHPGGGNVEVAGDAEAAPEEEANGTEPASERRGQGTPAGARLLATQMAVSGSSREEIATRLRNGFDIDDADAILDAILGPEG